MVNRFILTSGNYHLSEIPSLKFYTEFIVSHFYCTKRRQYIEQHHRHPIRYHTKRTKTAISIERYDNDAAGSSNDSHEASCANFFFISPWLLGICQTAMAKLSVCTISPCKSEASLLKHIFLLMGCMLKEILCLFLKWAFICGTDL